MHLLLDIKPDLASKYVAVQIAPIFTPFLASLLIFAKILFRNSETRGGAEIKIEWSNKSLTNI